jgi:hypothetical protein
LILIFFDKPSLGLRPTEIKNKFDSVSLSDEMKFKNVVVKSPVFKSKTLINTLIFKKVIGGR